MDAPLEPDPEKPVLETAEAVRTRRILSAAKAHLAERGFESMRLADVAREAGVAVGTVYLRFPGKLELLQAVMSETESRFEAALRDPSLAAYPFPERFHHIMAAMMAVAAAEDGLAKLMALTPFAMTPEYQPGARLRSAIADQLRDGIASGDLNPKIDLDLAASMAHGLVEGGMSHLMRDPTADPEALIEALANASARWLSRPV